MQIILLHLSLVSLVTLCLFIVIHQGVIISSIYFFIIIKRKQGLKMFIRKRSRISCACVAAVLEMIIRTAPNPK